MFEGWAQAVRDPFGREARAMMREKSRSRGSIFLDFRVSQLLARFSHLSPGPENFPSTSNNIENDNVDNDKMSDHTEQSQHQ